MSGVPTISTIVSIDPLSLLITIATVSGASGYAVTVNGTSYKTIFTGPIMTVRGLSPSTSYTIAVASIDSVTNILSAYSSPVTQSTSQDGQLNASGLYDPSFSYLLQNSSGTGSPIYWRGGSGIFTVVGTFSGATVTLQFLGPDNVTFLPVGSFTTLTAVGGGQFDLPISIVRAFVSGGPPSGLYASIAKG